MGQNSSKPNICIIIKPTNWFKYRILLNITPHHTTGVGSGWGRRAMSRTCPPPSNFQRGHLSLKFRRIRKTRKKIKKQMGQNRCTPTISRGTSATNPDVFHPRPLPPYNDKLPPWLHHTIWMFALIFSSETTLYDTWMADNIRFSILFFA